MPDCPVGIECMQVMPSPKTYDNMCLLEAAGATFLYEGACRVDTCTDSDNGKDYFIKGSTTICSSGGGGTEVNAGSCALHIDNCSSTTNLMEYYCNGNLLGTVNYVCPNGCKDGACIAPLIPNLLSIKYEIIRFNDAKGPASLYAYELGKFLLYVKNTGGPIRVSYLNTLVPSFEGIVKADDGSGQWTVNNIIISDSNYPNGIPTGTEFTYQFNGYITNSGQQTIKGTLGKTVCKTINVLPDPGCYDSDGGDVFIQGWNIGAAKCADQSKCRAYTRIADKCDSPNTLSEFYCENGFRYWKSVTCEKGCKDGACIPLVTYEAEASGNTLHGAARRNYCPDCSGGRMVSGMSSSNDYVIFNKINVETAGIYPLVISYLSVGDRGYKVSVNNGSYIDVPLDSGTSWYYPQNYTINISLNAGNNTIKFTIIRATSKPAPYLDKIVV